MFLMITILLLNTSLFLFVSAFSPVFKQADLRIIPKSKDNYALLTLSIFKNQVSYVLPNVIMLRINLPIVREETEWGKVKNPVMLVLNCNLI